MRFLLNSKNAKPSSKPKSLKKLASNLASLSKWSKSKPGLLSPQYEIDLEPGLRLNKIVALADDLAIAMRVPSVRIVAPIPGKNSVGVEVPNETRQMVRLRGVMEQCEAQIAKDEDPVVSWDPMRLEPRWLPISRPCLTC